MLHFDRIRSDQIGSDRYEQRKKQCKRKMQKNASYVAFFAFLHYFCVFLHWKDVENASFLPPGAPPRQKERKTQRIKPETQANSSPFSRVPDLNCNKGIAFCIFWHLNCDKMQKTQKKINCIKIA